MKSTLVIKAPNLNFPWLVHGFGLRNSAPPASLTTVKQIHSAHVLDACGRKDQQIGEGDAIISAELGVLVAIRTADCVPILIADPVARIVACVHAGWRGTAEAIVVATVRKMVARGSSPADIHAAIGPSIGPCCYEVGHDVARQFDGWMPPLPEMQSGCPRLDLRGINRMQLLDAGVGDIWSSQECTYCQPDRFFSFRREKEKAGRMLSFVGMAE